MRGGFQKCKLQEEKHFGAANGRKSKLQRMNWTGWGKVEITDTRFSQVLRPQQYFGKRPKRMCILQGKEFKEEWREEKKVDLVTSLMHLSMVCPRMGGSGNPGEIWHFQVLKRQFPHPWVFIISQIATPGDHRPSIKYVQRDYMHLQEVWCSTPPESNSTSWQMAPSNLVHFPKWRRHVLNT